MVRTSRVAALDRRIEESSGIRRAVWFDKLPAEVLADCVAIRAKYQQGGYKATKVAICRVLLDHCHERTGSKPSMDTAKRWIERKA